VLVAWQLHHDDEHVEELEEGGRWEESKTFMSKMGKTSEVQKLVGKAMDKVMHRSTVTEDMTE
jgi:hypothetical protein